MRSRPLLPQTIQVASVPLGLVSTKVPLISCSARCSVKLLFCQKVAAVVMIVKFVRAYSRL